MTPETRKAVFWSSLVTGALIILVIVGSRNLSHFDAALVAYTFASLFAAAGITFRYAIWLQRPPTALCRRILDNGASVTTGEVAMGTAMQTEE